MIHRQIDIHLVRLSAFGTYNKKPPAHEENGRTFMASTKRRYSKEEFARRGDAICEKDILHKLTAKDVGTAGGDEEVLRQLLPSFSRD